MCTRKSYENVVPISAAASQTATGSAQFSNNLFFIERSRRGLALSICPARFQFMYAATSIGTQVPETIHADTGVRPATRTRKTTTHHKVSKSCGGSVSFQQKNSRKSPLSDFHTA